MRTAVTAALLGIGTAAVPVNAVAKPPIACDTIYTIERSDTLFRIAAQAYGDGWLYKRIFQANRDLLAEEGSIEIGDQILIPCLDGTGPATRRDAIAQGVFVAPGEQAAAPVVTIEGPVQTAEAAIETTEESVQTAEEPGGTADRLLRTAVGLVRWAALPGHSIAGPARTDTVPARTTDDAAQLTERTMAESQAVGTPIRFLTASGFAPYADETLPEGGIIADLVVRAMAEIAPEQGVRVSFINDRPAHLTVLLPNGAFDVGFPWYRPDCSKVNQLGKNERILCAGFDFSNPFAEVPVAFYARAGDAVVSTVSHAGLFGKRLCRPKGHFMFDLVQNDLAEPNVSIEIPDTALQCFIWLSRGQVDVVTLARSEAEKQLRQLGVGDTVVEIEGLASAETLHAVVPKSNPNAQAYLDLLNRGLATLMLSGQWFEVVAFHQGLMLARAD